MSDKVLIITKIKIDDSYIFYDRLYDCYLYLVSGKDAKKYKLKGYLLEYDGFSYCDICHEYARNKLDNFPEGEEYISYVPTLASSYAIDYCKTRCYDLEYIIKETSEKYKYEKKFNIKL